jgi:hypothetical protein
MLRHTGAAGRLEIPAAPLSKSLFTKNLAYSLCALEAKASKNGFD